MDKAFELEISNPKQGETRATASLILPATPYELADALDKIRVDAPSDSLFLEIVDCELEYLPQFLMPDVHLYELNHLAEQLVSLEAWELDCFEGMVMMDAVQTQYAPILVERLINLGHSMEHCHIAYEAHNDTSLGKFYAENGFVPDLEALPENVFAWLDYGKIGKEMREGESGVFTPSGYVVQNGEISKVYQSGDAIPAEQPDYQILLELSKGWSHASEADSNCSFRFKLPADSGRLEAILAHSDAATLETLGWCCLDCRVPALRSAVNNSQDIMEVLRFTNLLQGVDDKALIKYKAVIGAVECDDLRTATVLANHLDQFILDRKIGSPDALARSELQFLINGEDGKTLQRFVNLYDYGQELLERDHAILSPYGHLARDDYQPILAPFEEIKHSGMEMM